MLRQMRDLIYICVYIHIHIYIMATSSSSQLFQIDNKIPNGGWLFFFCEVSLAVFISLIIVLLCSIPVLMPILSVRYNKQGCCLSVFHAL